MCGKLSTAFNNKLAAVVVVVVLFYLAECAAGGCSKWGHSCWGGHGKRNDAGLSGLREIGPDEFPSGMRWFMGKLLRNPEEAGRMLRDAPLSFKMMFKNGENDENNEDINQNGDNPVIENLFSDGERYREKIPMDKIHFLKFLKNNADKMI